MLKLVEFLTIQERRQFESITTSWANSITHTRTNPTKGSRWVTFKSYSGSRGIELAASPRGPCLPMDHPYPTAHPYSPPMMPISVQNPARIWGTWLHSRNELSSHYAKGTFNLDGRSNNDTVLNRHRRDQHNQTYHCLHIRSLPVSIYIIITWLFSTIANIANRDRVSTYISQVTGNHPTSTGLSMAKHVFRFLT